MKQIIMIAAAVFILASCDVVMGLGSPEESLRWINENVSYTRDGVDHWQTPKETLSRRLGDCEDFASLWAAALRDYGIEVDLIIIRQTNGYHMVVEYNNEWVSPSYFNEEGGRVPAGSLPEVERYTLDQYMWYAATTKR